MPQRTGTKDESATADAAPEIMTEKEIAKALGGQEVATVQNLPEFDSDSLAAIESWDDVDAVLSAAGVEIEFADRVLGDGFSILSTDAKMELIGKPMMLLEWRFNDGQMGRFVSIRAVVKTGELKTDIKKVIINDGSTGILKQLDEFSSKTGKQAGLVVRRGLRVSEYNFEDSNGVQRPAKTFYLDASA